MAEKTRKVTVVVGPRELGGVWAGGLRWSTGSTEADVPEDKLHIIARRDDTLVYENGKRIRSVGAPPAQTSAILTRDELAALNDYRAQKAKDPKVAEKYGPDDDGPRFETVDDAPSLSDAETGFIPGGTGSRISAHTPIQDKDVLAGRPPPEPVTQPKDGEKPAEAHLPGVAPRAKR